MRVGGPFTHGCCCAMATMTYIYHGLTRVHGNNSQDMKQDKKITNNFSCLHETPIMVLTPVRSYSMAHTRGHTRGSTVWGCRKGECLKCDCCQTVAGSPLTSAVVGVQKQQPSEPNKNTAKIATKHIWCPWTCLASRAESNSVLTRRLTRLGTPGATHYEARLGPKHASCCPCSPSACSAAQGARIYPRPTERTLQICTQ